MIKFYGKLREVNLIRISTFVDDGSTCIGWEGKMFKVGGLIPEFSAQTNSQWALINNTSCR